MLDGVLALDVALEASTFTLEVEETCGALEAGMLEVAPMFSSKPRETIPIALRGDTNAGMIAPNSKAARMPETTSLKIFILVGSKYTVSVREEP